MKFLFFSALISIALNCSFVSSTFANENSVNGPWKTIDDETGAAKSIVNITEEDGKLVGKISQLFRKPDEDQDPKCDKCSGDKKDKPMIGMTILWDMKKNGDKKWDSGSILNPKEGKTYSCKLELIEGGKKLKVRGFLGFSLFGRTQVWERP